MLLLLCFLSLGCTLSAQEPERETAKEARIFRLPEFERAFLCVRYFEGWHSEKNHPYVGWGALPPAGREILGTHHDKTAG